MIYICLCEIYAFNMICIDVSELLYVLYVFWYAYEDLQVLFFLGVYMGPMGPGPVPVAGGRVGRSVGRSVGWLVGRSVAPPSTSGQAHGQTVNQ